MTLKCLNCGCTKLVKTTLITKEGPRYSGWEESFTFPSQQTKLDAFGELKAYICPECGHVEFFTNYSEAKALDEKRKAELKEKVELHNQKILDIQQKIELTKKVISSENSTVKQVKEAKSALPELEKELRVLKTRRI